MGDIDFNEMALSQSESTILHESIYKVLVSYLSNENKVPEVLPRVYFFQSALKVHQKSCRCTLITHVEKFFKSALIW